jgi:hypothetical protein
MKGHYVAWKLKMKHLLSFYQSNIKASPAITMGTINFASFIHDLDSEPETN